jgi:hypothetical protein
MIRWHKHHIIPKHAGGTDELHNIIKVNIAMHAFLHKQLYEEHGRWQDNIAHRFLSGAISCQEATRQSQILANLGNTHRKGKKRSQEERDKISKALKGKSKPKGFGKKMCDALTGRKQTPEHISNKVAAATGKKRGQYKKRIQ